MRPLNPPNREVRDNPKPTTHRSPAAARTMITTAILALAAVLGPVLAPPTAAAAPTPTDYDDVTSSSRTAMIKMVDTDGGPGCNALIADIELKLTGLNSSGGNISSIRVYNRTARPVKLHSVGGFGGFAPGLQIGAYTRTAWISVHRNAPIFPTPLRWYPNGGSNEMNFNFYTTKNNTNIPNFNCIMGNKAMIYAGPGLKSGTVSNQVERLYKAYFLRSSDQGGRNFWFKQAYEGRSLTSISNSFVGSAEFRNRYGSLSDGDFIRLVYTNVLGRSADSGGYRYWLNRLRQGMTRGELMLHFSFSNEFKQRTGLY